MFVFTQVNSFYGLETIIVDSFIILGSIVLYKLGSLTNLMLNTWFFSLWMSIIILISNNLK